MEKSYRPQRQVKNLIRIHGFPANIMKSTKIIKSYKSLLIPTNFYHYRTQNKLEIDLIIEHGETIIPIEIKAGSFKSMKQLSGLQQFLSDHPHSPFGILINRSEDIAKLDKNIIQIPANYF